MTPQQKVEHVWNVVRNARQNQFTRQQFVSITNRLWDAVEGGESDAAPQQLALGVTNNANTISEDAHSAERDQQNSQRDA